MVQAWSKQWHPGETFAGPVAPSFFTSSSRWIDVTNGRMLPSAPSAQSTTVLHVPCGQAARYDLSHVSAANAPDAADLPGRPSSASRGSRQQPHGRPSSACLNEERGRRHVKPAVDVTFLCREDVSVDRIEGILRDKMCVRKVNRRRIRGLCVRPFPCRYARVNGGEMHPRCVRNFFSRFDRHCHPLSSAVERELHRCSRSGSRHRAETTPAASHVKTSLRSCARPDPSQRLLGSAVRMRP